MFWFGKAGSDIHVLIQETPATSLAWGTEAVDTSWRGPLGCRLCLWRTTQKHALLVCMVCGKQRRDQQGESSRVSNYGLECDAMMERKAFVKGNALLRW